MNPEAKRFTGAAHTSAFEANVAEFQGPMVVNLASSAAKHLYSVYFVVLAFIQFVFPLIESTNLYFIRRFYFKWNLPQDLLPDDP